MKFHLIKLGGRPLLAVPASGKNPRGASIHCYPAHTWKKCLVRSLLGAASRIGVLPWVFPAREGSLPHGPAFDFPEWLESVRRSLGEPDLQPVIVWPADPGRGRVYIHLLGPRGNRIAFCKLGLDERNNELIRREGEALRQMEQSGPRNFRVPGVLESGSMGDCGYLVVRAAPPGARITEWKRDPPIHAILPEFQGEVRQVKAGGVGSLRWWAPLLEAAETPAFRTAVLEAADRGCEVCRVHGDLNRTNILRHGSDVWLLDWERSDGEGPCLTDPVCMAVDRLWRDGRADSPHAPLERFLEEFVAGRDAQARHRAVLALGYLAAAGFTPAMAIIRAWFPPDGGPGGAPAFGHRRAG